MSGSPKCDGGLKKAEVSRLAEEQKRSHIPTRPRIRLPEAAAQN